MDLNRWRDSLTAIINAAIVGDDPKAERAIRDAGLLLGRQINTLAGCEQNMCAEASRARRTKVDGHFIVGVAKRKRELAARGCQRAH